MSDRNYVVKCGRGRVTVMVRGNTIAMRGEREAVAQAAWFKLLGKNELGEDVDKTLVTRKVIMTQLLSTYEPYRHRVYEQFRESVSFVWVGIA